MKKIFSTVAALGLVAGMATAASALDFSVTGKYTVEGYYITEMNHGEVSVPGLTMQGVLPISDSSNELGSDAFFIQYFWMFPELKINDKTKVKAEVRLSDESIWGSQDDAMTNSGPGSTTITTTPYDPPGPVGPHTHDVNVSNADATRDLDIHKLWMEWDSPRGKVMIGRQTDAFGTAFLNDENGHADRIIWAPNFLADPWTLSLLYEKTTEGEAYNGSVDEDDDLYEIAIGRKAENSKFELAYAHIVNQTDATASQIRERIRGWADLAYNNYFVQGEFSYDFGDWADYDSSSMQDVDLDSLALFIAAGGKFNNLTAYLAYVYASGQDPNDDDMTAAMAGPAAVGLGSSFQPFYIWTGSVTGMYSDYVNPSNTLLQYIGLHCFGLFGDYALTEKLSLHGGVGYALADEEDWVASDIDNEIGWEVNLGAGYKILDNLKYEVHLGWFGPGEMFDDIADGTTMDTNDVYLVSNHLTLSF